MKTSSKISIVVPIYNSAQFLKGCIDSILNQTLTDFELILVDDGSKDLSGTICDEYAKIDKRVKVIHKQNAGASEARNTGIKESLGELITFIDADDIITLNYLQELYEDYLKVEDVDFVIQGLVQKFPNEDKIFKLTDRVYDLGTSDSLLFFDNVYLNDFSGPYCKLYRRSIILKHNLSFSSNIIYAEDFDFMLRYLMHSKRVITSSVFNYYYIMHAGSVSSKIYPFDKELSGLYQIFASFEALVKTTGSVSLKKMMIDSINMYMWRIIYANYRNNYNRGGRLTHFSSIEIKVLRFFGLHYTPKSLFTQLVKKLLIKQQYHFLDLILRIRL